MCFQATQGCLPHAPCRSVTTAGTFKATFAFAYLVAAMFILFFLVLIVAPRGFVGECQQRACFLPTRQSVRAGLTARASPVTDTTQTSSCCRKSTCSRCPRYQPRARPSAPCRCEQVSAWDRQSTNQLPSHHCIAA